MNLVLKIHWKLKYVSTLYMVFNTIFFSILVWYQQTSAEIINHLNVAGDVIFTGIIS